jgi:hypothetical protein
LDDAPSPKSRKKSATCEFSRPRFSAGAVRCKRGSWPIANRPQLGKLPHKSALYGVNARDFHIYASISLMLGMVALAAG